MSITINEDRIEIGIPRKIKELAGKISDSHSVTKQYKKVVKRSKRLEAVVEELNEVFGEDQRFKSILEEHKVTL